MSEPLLDKARHFKHRYLMDRPLWTIALYKLKDSRSIFDIASNEPFAFIGESGLRRSKTYQSTVADPFLFPRAGRMYVFYEVQTDFGPGEIHAAELGDGGVKERCGCVLKEPFHLSYPQVFFHEGEVWMVPETASDKRVWLYRCNSFPTGWRRERVLIDAELVDPSLIFGREGIYILGTTRRLELKIFFALDFQSEFVDLGFSITDDRMIARNAGAPIDVDGKLYRVAQNYGKNYGENISVLEVMDLGEGRYAERLVIDKLFKSKPPWMSLGCHHISIAPYGGECLVAIDGQRPDRLLNNLALAFFDYCA